MSNLKLFPNTKCIQSIIISLYLFKMFRPTKKIKISNNVSNFDWNKCCLCQTNDGVIISPTKNPIVSKTNSAYEFLANQIYEFDKLGKLPNYIHFGFLNSESNIENTLRKNEAKWHKKCYVMLNDEKLKRIKCKIKKSDLNESKCFLCFKSGTEDDALRNVETLELDGKLYTIFFRNKTYKLRGLGE